MSKDQSDQLEFEQRYRSYQPRESKVLRRSSNYSRIISDIHTKPSVENAKNQTPPEPQLADNFDTFEVPVPEIQEPAKRSWRLASWRKLALVAGLALLLVSIPLLGRTRNLSDSNLLGSQTLAASEQSETVASHPNTAALGEPDAPKTLKIEKISLSSSITKGTGTAVQAPSKPAVISWLANTKPADSGKAVVLTGSAEGTFAQLKNLQVGDSIVLEQHDGKTHSYEVITTRVYAAGAIDSNKVLAPVSAGDGLNLVGFSGSGNDALVLVVFALKV